MALPGKENPFANGLTEKAPSPGIKTKKSFVKIPLSTGVQTPVLERNSPNLDFPERQTDNTAMAKSAIAENTTAPNRIQNTIPENIYTEPPIADKEQPIADFAIAKNTIAGSFADKKGGYTRIDNYVFDVLLPTIKNASAAIVYIYLWRRSLGYQKSSVCLSHQIIADSVGLSKRAVQDAMIRLNDLKLVRSYRAYETAIPEHFILRPWNNAKNSETESNLAMAKSAIAKNAIAEKDASYSKICHSAIANFATTKRKVLNKERKALSLSLSNKFPEELIARWESQTEKKEKREREIYLSLCRKFGEESVYNNIVCIINDICKYGLRDGSQPVDLMAILEVDYPWFEKRAVENAYKEQKQESKQVAIEVMSELKHGYAK